jgi:tetratricopeptide (TPR) repeat protein
MNAAQTTALRTPYPLLRFCLGTYYNDLGRSEDALRTLDAGLALPTPLPDSDLGKTVPLLIGERGAALDVLKRPQDALTNFDRGLKIKSLKAEQHALMLRGRGFALTELGQLDEAEQSYRDSLEVEPNHQPVMNEITYIQSLRAERLVYGHADDVAVTAAIISPSNRSASRQGEPSCRWCFAIVRPHSRNQVRYLGLAHLHRATR